MLLRLRFLHVEIWPGPFLWFLLETGETSRVMFTDAPERETQNYQASNVYLKSKENSNVYIVLISALPKKIKMNDLKMQRLLRSPTPAKVSHSAGDVPVDTGFIFNI